MDYHQNARLTRHSRELLAKRVLEQGFTLQLAAASCNVSAKTAAKWVRRYREHGADGLGDRSSRPHRCPRATSSALLENVLALRRLRYNGWRIAQVLAISRATVSRILRRAGMNRLQSLDPPPPVVRYEHRRPGSLIHFDIKRLARIVQPGHRIHGDRTRKTAGAGYEYLHIAIDDHSRIAFAAILPSQTGASAQLFFHMTRAHFSRFGFSVRRVLTTTAPATKTTASASCSTASMSSTGLRAPTPRAPTARRNASSRPCLENGLTHAPTKPHWNATNNSTHGSMTTTSTDPMTASNSTHPLPEQA
jgi:transposase